VGDRVRPTPRVPLTAGIAACSVCCDALRVTDAGDRIIPNDELGADDRSALGWAVSTGHRVGTDIVRRVRDGGAGFSVPELAALHRDWETAGRPAPDRHVHRTQVRFADDTTVTGVTFLVDEPYLREDPPGFGLYFDERWAPPWPHEHLDWPDFGVPEDLDALRRALTDVLERARTGASVEVGCLGGHGRTGTALACLAVLAGTSATDAVAWVRAHYCGQAIETDEQEELVATFGL
jgi:hypothetical protein